MDFNPQGFSFRRIDLESQKPQNSYEIHFPKNGTVIGRDVKCDRQVVSTIASRRHCVVSFSGNKLYIKNLGTNGTFVNGAKINSETELKEDDFVGIGCNTNTNPASENHLIYKVRRMEQIDLLSSDDEETTNTSPEVQQLVNKEADKVERLTSSNVENEPLQKDCNANDTMTAEECDQICAALLEASVGSELPSETIEISDEETETDKKWKGKVQGRSSPRLELFRSKTAAEKDSDELESLPSSDESESAINQIDKSTVEGEKTACILLRKLSQEDIDVWGKSIRVKNKPYNDKKIKLNTIVDPDSDEEDSVKKVPSEQQYERIPKMMIRRKSVTEFEVQNPTYKRRSDASELVEKKRKKHEVMKRSEIVVPRKGPQVIAPPHMPKRRKSLYEPTTLPIKQISKRRMSVASDASSGDVFSKVGELRKKQPLPVRRESVDTRCSSEEVKQAKRDKLREVAMREAARKQEAEEAVNKLNDENKKSANKPKVKLTQNTRAANLANDISRPIPMPPRRMSVNEPAATTTVHSSATVLKPVGQTMPEYKQLMDELKSKYGSGFNENANRTEKPKETDHELMEVCNNINFYGNESHVSEEISSVVVEVEGLIQERLQVPSNLELSVIKVNSLVDGLEEISSQESDSMQDGLEDISSQESSSSLHPPEEVELNDEIPDRNLSNELGSQNSYDRQKMPQYLVVSQPPTMNLKSILKSPSVSCNKPKTRRITFATEVKVKTYQIVTAMDYEDHSEESNSQKFLTYKQYRESLAARSSSSSTTN